MKPKHVLEFFRNDHWRVRLVVLVLYWTFLLALAGLITESVDKSLFEPLLRLILRRLI